MHGRYRRLRAVGWLAGCSLPASCCLLPAWLPGCRAQSGFTGGGPLEGTITGPKQPAAHEQTRKPGPGPGSLRSCQWQPTAPAARRPPPRRSQSPRKPSLPRGPRPSRPSPEPEAEPAPSVPSPHPPVSPLAPRLPPCCYHLARSLDCCCPASQAARLAVPPRLVSSRLLSSPRLHCTDNTSRILNILHAPPAPPCVDTPPSNTIHTSLSATPPADHYDYARPFPIAATPQLPVYQCLERVSRSRNRQKKRTEQS